MATTQTQLRRGTNAQVNAMTPAEGEVVVDMTNDRLCLGDGTRQGGFPIPNFSDCQKNTFSYAVSAGTANALTVALSPPLLSYVEGVSFSFRATTTNTGSATINVNGLGAIGIRQQDLSTLPAGAITSGRNYELTYNGTYFVIVSAGAAVSVSDSGLILLGSASAAAGTIDLTGMMDNSLYSNYKIAFRRLTVSASGFIAFRASVDNGASYIASGYGVAAASDGTSTPAPASASGQATPSSVNTSYYSGEIEIIDADVASAATWHAVGFARLVSTVTSITDKFGAITNSAPVDAIRLLHSGAGTITGGTASIYGYAK